MTIVTLIAGSLVLILTLVMAIRVNNAIKQREESPLKSISDFQDEYINMEIYRNEEKIDESKLYYDDIESFYEKEHYVFLKVNAGAYMPVDKVPGLVDLLISKGLLKK